MSTITTTETSLKPADDIRVIPTPPAPRRRRGTVVLAGLVAAAAIATGVSVVAITSGSSSPTTVPGPSRMSADTEERWRTSGVTPSATSGASSSDSYDADLRCISATITADAAERCTARR